MPLLTVGELIDRSWDHYRKEFVDLISVSGWILLTAIANIAALAIYPSASKIIGNSSLSPVEGIGVGLFAFSNWVMTPLLGLWIFATLVRLVATQRAGARTGVVDAMREGKRFFLPVLAVSALLFLVLAAVIMVSFGPSVLLSLLAGATNNNALLLLASLSLVAGVVVSIILGFRWSVQYYFAPYAALLDGKRGKEALTASRLMITGRYGQTLLRLLVPKLVFIALGILAMAVAAFVLSMAASALSGLNLDIQLRLSTISTSVLSTVVAALLNPLIVIADLLLYQSLKQR